MRKLPKDVFVVLRNKGTEDKFLMATVNLDDLDDGELVGHYRQIELLKVERSVTTAFSLKAIHDDR